MQLQTGGKTIIAGALLKEWEYEDLHLFRLL